MEKKEKKEKVYPDTLKKEHNVQIPVEVLLHQSTDAYDIMVFSYMKLRYQFFTMKGLPFCESNSTIAAAIGLSRRKVIECINKLESLGFLHRELRNVSGVDKKEQTNIYKVTDCMSESKQVARREIKKQVKETNRVKVTDSLVDEYWDCPF
jgi:hypothetical protein